MDIGLLHNEEDYRAALAEVSALVDIDPEANTPDGDRLELLRVLVGRYEDEHFPLERPDPIEAIKFRMEQEQLSIADMQEYIGGANRVYEVLAGQGAFEPGDDSALARGVAYSSRGVDSRTFPSQQVSATRRA